MIGGDETRDAVADVAEQKVEPLIELDAAGADVAPEVAVAESLRSALEAMREEADRIAALKTGDEQVTAAEQFAEGAGQLDEEIGSAARADDDARG